GHDSVDDESFGRTVGRNQRQDQAALAEPQGINVKAQAAQREGVQSDVRLAQREVRSDGVVRAAQADVFGHQAVIPAKPQPGEVEVHSPRAQFGHEARFEKLRQTDSIQIDQSAEQQEDRKQQGNTAPTKAAPKFSPETQYCDKEFSIHALRQI